MAPTHFIAPESSPSEQAQKAIPSLVYQTFGVQSIKLVGSTTKAMLTRPAHLLQYQNLRR